MTCVLCGTPGATSDLEAARGAALCRDCREHADEVELRYASQRDDERRRANQRRINGENEA